MSTIQNQVKQKIFGKYKVEGFVSLVKSAGLLQKTFEILGFIKRETENVPEEEKLELVFGNAIDIFNSHDDIDYYFFAFPSENNSTSIIYVQVSHPLMNFEELKKSRKYDNRFITFDIVKYYKGKDPPTN